jgi:cytoskeletal protein CcmA (bactofilin family)
MLTMKKQPHTPSHIGAGMKVAGPCAFQGELRIDGWIAGDVLADDSADSTLILSESGRVEGRVSAHHLYLAGTVVGPVIAGDVLELKATAHVEGDVRYKTLEMRPGAVVIGLLQPEFLPALTGDAEPAAATPAAEAPQVAAQEPTEPTLDPNRSLDLELQPGNDH